MKRHKLLQHWYAQVAYAERRVGINIFTHFPAFRPFPPPPVRTRTSEEAERNLVGFERCGCPETIKFLLLTGYRNKEIFQVLRAKRVTPERVAQRSADVSNPLSP